MCIYIIYSFESIVSKAWPPSSVFFKIINIIFHFFKNQKRENSLAEHLNSNNHSFPEGIKLISRKGSQINNAIESLTILKSYNRNSDLCLNSKFELSESALLKMYCHNKKFLDKGIKKKKTLRCPVDPCQKRYIP